MTAATDKPSGSRMKAVRSPAYGPPSTMTTDSIDIPQPGPGQVLVKLRATSVNPADWHLLRGEPRIARLAVGLRRPRASVLGCDISGQVAALGADVDGFNLDDDVVGSTFMEGFGAFADYALVKQELLVAKPASVSHQDAATLPMAGCTALQGIRDVGKLRGGQRVLIVGASGGVGTFTVQLAVHLGAEVTAVCSTTKVEMVGSLGAHHIVDYHKETLADVAKTHQPYDLVVQAAGPDSISSLRAVAARQATVVLISGDAKGRWLGPARRALAAALVNPFVSQRLASFTVAPSAANLRTLLELVEAGDLKPVIDRSYPLDQVPEALSYLEEGHAAGKVCVLI